MTSPGWFPEWSGDTAVVAGTGPSLNAAELSVCVGRAKLIVVGKAWLLEPLAHVLYSCDWQWWAHHAPHAADFRGLRVRGSTPTSGEAQALKPIELQRVATPFAVRCAARKEAPLQWLSDYTANGGNSGFQAANLAARWGAKRIVLLGMDCNAPESHFPGGGDSRPGRSIQGKGTVDGWLSAWENSAKEYCAAGVQVINASPASRITAFPKLPLREAL